ncbi:MAG: hypothetical protein JSS04_19825 [Proteobacteria bacterium]|nr:hypothetical protein [Pseudomonadota bacterium]
MRPLWSIIVALAVAACTSVPLASRDADAAAKRFEPPPPGWAILYIVREGYMLSDEVAVLVDQRSVGSLAYDTYQRLELPPGQHDVRAENLEYGQTLAVTTVQLAAGEIRFVTIANAVFDSPLARTVTEMSAREMPATAGRSAVLSRRLAAGSGR